MIIEATKNLSLTTYQIQAFSLFDSINLKELRTVFSGEIIGTSHQELQVQYGEKNYLFVYRFGCFVFFNMSAEIIEQEISKLKKALGNGLPLPTTETYQVHVGNFTAEKVEFQYVELNELSVENLRLIALTVGQSAALEHIELACDKLIHDTTSFLESMAKHGRIPYFQNKQLMRIIGSTASTRQLIISNLSVLDPPDSTWKSKELEKIYKDLQNNFDIEIRFRNLDRKLSLVQDNIELLADLMSKIRFMVLEVLIVLLIFIELFVAMRR